MCKPTLFFGSMRVTPSLLIAIKRTSGKFVSEDCCGRISNINKPYIVYFTKNNKSNTIIEENVILFARHLGKSTLHHIVTNLPWLQKRQIQKLATYKWFLETSVLLPLEISLHGYWSMWRQAAEETKTCTFTAFTCHKWTFEVGLVLLTHPFPVVGWELTDQVLRNELLQHLGEVEELWLVLLKPHPVNQRSQLESLFKTALVVATQVLWELLKKSLWRWKSVICVWKWAWMHRLSTERERFPPGSNGKWSRPWDLCLEWCWSTVSSCKTLDRSVKALCLQNEQKH